MSRLAQIAEMLVNGPPKTRAADIKTLVEQAVQESIAPADILNKALLVGMSVVGEKFKKNEVYVPDVIIAARAMKAGTEVLKPLLVDAGVQAIGTVVMGTIKGDLHDIGKNLVCMMLEGAGFKVIDAGISVEPGKLLELAIQNNAKIIGVSALLTTTMMNMKGLMNAIQAVGQAGKIKVMIGGAPVTQAFCDEIGADGYAPDAASAVDKAKELINE